MKKLALALSAMLILGILGAGVLAKNDKAKSYGKGGKYGEETDPAPNNGNGNGWGKEGNPNKPETEEEEEGEELETEEEETEEEETEEEETEEEGNGNGKPTPKYPADHNGLHKTRGKVRHLYLYEKDDTTWDPVDGGAWGKMTYRPSGKTFRYTFTAHGLEPGEEYSLIYYPDPWPGSGLICLGNGTANNGGNVHISDRLDISDIPTEADENFEDGAKIWLVLTSDVDCYNQEMIGWNQSEYLFEYDVITYNGPQE